MTTRSIPHSLVVVPLRGLCLWPSRLSLQAPIVAVLWQFLLASSLGVALDPFAPWALGLTVWLIYVADHLIDTAQPARGVETPRKSFCRRHWNLFLVIAAFMAIALVIMVSHFLLATTVQVGWRLSLGVAGYFAIIHLTPTRWRQAWPRELVVATLFALGTFCAVWSMNLIPAAILFIALCCTNCSVIETWEQDEAPNRLARWMAAHLSGAGLSITIGAALLGWTNRILLPFSIAAGLSGLAFVCLARCKERISIRFVSPLTDLVLCSPLLVLWLRLS